MLRSSVSTLAPLLVAAAVLAQAPHPVMSAFAPDAQNVLTVDGKPVEARLYLSRRAAAMLVVAAELDRPILVWAASQRVDAISEAALLERGDGGFDLAQGVERSYLGTFRPQEGELILPIEGRDVRLAPRPALVGLHRLEALLAHLPDYAPGLAAYTPAAGQLAALAEQPEPIRVLVFFGTWCGVCRQFLPNALRLDRELADSRIRFEYYGLAYPPKGWEDPEVKKHGVEGLPTAVVYRGGEMLGRFKGAKAFSEPERSLLDLLGEGGS